MMMTKSLVICIFVCWCFSACNGHEGVESCAVSGVAETHSAAYAAANTGAWGQAIACMKTHLAAKMEQNKPKLKDKKDFAKLVAFADWCHFVEWQANAATSVKELPKSVGEDLYHCLAGIEAALKLKSAGDGGELMIQKATVLFNFANRLRQLGAVQKSLPMYNETRAAFSKAFNTSTQPSVKAKAAKGLSVVEHNLAMAYAAIGAPNEKVLKHYLRALKWNANQTQSHINVALLYEKESDYAQAETHYLSALSNSPTVAESQYYYGLFLEHRGRRAEARLRYRNAIDLDSSYLMAYAGLARVLQKAIHDNAFGESKTPGQGAEDQEAPLNPHQELLSLCEASLTTVMPLVKDKKSSNGRPFPDEVLKDYGTMLYNAGTLQLATHSSESLTSAIRFFKGALSVYGKLSVNATEDPLTVSQRAYCNNNMGIAYDRLGDLDQALRHYKSSIKLLPNFTRALTNIGTIYKTKGNTTRAIEFYQRALKANEKFAEAHTNLGSLYSDSDSELALAAHHYHRALISPEEFSVGEAFFSYLHVLKRMCDWTNRTRLGLALQHRLDWEFISLANQVDQSGVKFAYPIIDDGFAPPTPPAGSRLSMSTSFFSGLHPLHALSHDPLPVEYVDAIVKVHAYRVQWDALETILPTLKEETKNMLWAGGSPQMAQQKLVATSKSFGKLVVAYVSSDFRSHPVAECIRGVIQSHDKTRFTILCFYNLALQKPDDSTTEIFERSCDRLIRFDGPNELFDLLAAEKARGEPVDVLIDLNGNTQGGMERVTSLRAAPVQLNFIGFPHWVSGRYLDFFVTDRIVTPPSGFGKPNAVLSRVNLTSLDLSERVVLLPASFLPLSHAVLARSSTEGTNKQQAFDRADFGLPARPALVLCSLNQNYKITPAIFAVWMNILRCAPRHTVLWILRTLPETTAEALKAQVKAHGIDSARVVMGTVLPLDAHIAIKAQLCDLALDTAVYNGHVTSADALFGGLPVLALYGPSMPSRTCASMLVASGCSELVAKSFIEYEDKAVCVLWKSSAAVPSEHLSNMCKRFSLLSVEEYKQRLQDSPSGRLFGVKQWTANWERALLLMASTANQHIVLRDPEHLRYNVKPHRTR